MGLWPRGFCKGLTRGANIGGSANRLTFGKGTQLVIQPCKFLFLGCGDLNRVPTGTFPTTADESLVPRPSVAPSHTKGGDELCR